jgi:hypothetical protein
VAETGSGAAPSAPADTLDDIVAAGWPRLQPSKSGFKN